jgi:hypothetical protein
MASIAAHIHIHIHTHTHKHTNSEAHISYSDTHKHVRIQGALFAAAVYVELLGTATKVGVPTGTASWARHFVLCSGQCFVCCDEKLYSKIIERQSQSPQ